MYPITATKQKSYYKSVSSFNIYSYIMLNKVSNETVNRSMQDLWSNNQLFGRLTFLLDGNFRQTLLVVIIGTLVDEINACLKH